MKGYRALSQAPAKGSVMAPPTDPRLRPGRRRVTAMQSPDLCAWCLGAGTVLEPLDWGMRHAYLPVVCRGCDGTGRRPGTR